MSPRSGTLRFDSTTLVRVRPAMTIVRPSGTETVVETVRLAMVGE